MASMSRTSGCSTPLQPPWFAQVVGICMCKPTPRSGSRHIYSACTSRVYAICASGDLILDHLHRARYKFVARCGGM
ncbi:hypothetical protein IG631_20436 [Alternaria alternata]|nr:hypothetical protein IG631_20436 [Alternaria alternata]